MPESNVKLNIAMLGHKRIPSREGGVEIVVEELSTRMVKLGHNVVCYNRKGHHVSGKEFDNALISNYKNVLIKEVFTVNKGGLSALSSSLFAALKASFSKCDIVHFHAEGPCAMIWLPKLFKKKCIATIHGLDHQRAKWGKFASHYILFGEKCAVRFADKIIVLSENLKKYFKENYNRDTIFIPNGINKPEIKKDTEIKDKYGLVKGEYILFLGRLVPEKGIDYLIKAFKNIKTNKKLVIAGGASEAAGYEEELHNLAKDNENIIFTGFVQGEILEELYSNSYLYVLPSDLEGMPLSLLEAMSYGNCCLTSDIPECSEICPEYNNTFKKGNIEDLQLKLQYLCDNPQRVEECKLNISDYVLKKYNWDNVVKETLLLYGIAYEQIAAEDEIYENFAHK